MPAGGGLAASVGIADYFPRQYEGHAVKSTAMVAIRARSLPQSEKWQLLRDKKKSDGNSRVRRGETNT